QEKTGLIIDSYFSGTKIKWILDHVDGARKKAEEGKLAFGTVDSWLIWNFTKGDLHVPMSRMHPVPCSTILESKSGMTNCWSCWISRENCCRKCTTPARCTAPLKPLFLLMKCPLRVLPAISRQPCLARCACSQVC